MQRPDTVAVREGVLKIQTVRLEEDTRVNEINFGLKYKSIAISKMSKHSIWKTIGFSCTGDLSTEDCELPPGLVTTIPPIATGQLSTRNSFNFIFGRIEVRAKLPNADWVFPQIWLQPLDNAYGPNNYASGQMRVAHASANEHLFGGALLDSEAPFRLLRMCRSGSRWSDDYHVYSLYWSPGNLCIRCQTYGLISLKIRYSNNSHLNLI